MSYLLANLHSHGAFRAARLVQTCFERSPRGVEWLYTRCTPGLLLLLVGCVGLEFPPEPSTDEEGSALNEALQTLASSAECSDSGAVWPSGPMDSDALNPVLLGLSYGSAGVLRGISSGASQLLEYPLGEGDAAAPPDEVESLYLPLLIDATRFLAAHASQTDTNGLYWPQCVETSGSATDESCYMPGIAPGLARSCPADMDSPAIGLESGVAGIGDSFLTVAEQAASLGWEDRVLEMQTEAQGSGSGTTEGSLASIATVCDLVSVAQGAGQFLRDSGCADGGFPEVGMACTNTSIRYTGLDRGAAGVGLFFLRLWHVTADRIWLDAANDVGGWLVSLLEDPSMGELPSEGAVPISVGGEDERLLTGFWQGNSGVAWFLLETAYQLEQAGETAAAARLLAGGLAILRFLQRADVKVSALGGAYWRTHVGSTDSGIQTGVSDGIAGISWVFLQASASGLEGTQGLEQVAEEGARYLAHSLVAHYFRGRVWWPSRLVEGNGLEPTHAWQTLSQPLDTWSPGDVDADVLRGWTLHPGLSVGVSGIGQFFRAMSEESVFGSDGVGCFEEISDEAAHFLYLLGRPENPTSDWQWPERIVRLISGDAYTSPGSASLATGASGIAHFLASDRKADLALDAAGPASVLGLNSFLGRAPSVLCTASRMRPPRTSSSAFASNPLPSSVNWNGERHE